MQSCKQSKAKETDIGSGEGVKEKAKESPGAVGKEKRDTTTGPQNENGINKTDEDGTEIKDEAERPAACSEY